MKDNKEKCNKPSFVFEVMMEIKNNKKHKKELLKLFKENRWLS